MWWVLLALLLLLLLLLLRCHRRVAEPPFDYFQAKAAELGNDADRILRFVRDDVRALSYRGDVKGALGALWDGAASPEEKLALANALLAHAAPPRSAMLDDVAPGRDKGGDAGAAVCKVTIVHRLLGADGPHETTVYSGPIGNLVGDVHTIDSPDSSTTRFQLRGAALAQKVIPRADAIGEDLEFTVERPDGEPLKEVRELWRKDNAIGPQGTLVGDRHDIVVLPCRIGKYVREKEELLLKQRGRKDAPESRGYLALLDYALMSDALLEKVEAARKVRARYDVPRILILSRYNLPGHPAYALDLRVDRTGFDGARYDAYTAAQMRSFVESGLEQDFLTQWTGCPCTSTFDVFCQLRDGFPNTVARRLEAISNAIEALLEHGGKDARAAFRARPAGGHSRPDLPTVTVRREGGAVRVQGGPVKPEFVRRAKEQDLGLPYDAQGRLDAAMVSTTDATLAVETTLSALSRPDYVLDALIDCGDEPLVAPEARLRFAWGEGDARTDQRIVVRECSGGLDLSCRVSDGSSLVNGTRHVSDAALEEATAHNPWYDSGASTQDDATSFCVSRKVFASLKAGTPVTLSLQSRRPAGEEPGAKRPVEWTGPVKPLGPGTVRVRVNGQEEELHTLRCEANGRTLCLLDDPLFPVGMADRLTEVWTSIRGRLVDEKGIGVAGAQVSLGDERHATTCRTWPDGGFRLPPSSSGAWGRVTLRLSLGEEDLGEQEVDLSAPGRKVVTLTAKRPRKELVFIGAEEGEKLDALRISDQAKRHARADLAAGRMVVVPNQMVALGPGLRTVGYYAYDTTSGDISGVTEDGLHGSEDAVLERGKELAVDTAIKAATGKLKAEATAFVHMYRGALVAAWNYCSFRLEGLSHEEAIVNLILQMDEWEKATNILEQFEEAVGQIPLTRFDELNQKIGAKVSEKLDEMVGGTGLGGLASDTAKISFQYGYLITAYGLSVKLEGS